MRMVHILQKCETAVSLSSENENGSRSSEVWDCWKSVFKEWEWFTFFRSVRLQFIFKEWEWFELFGSTRLLEVRLQRMRMVRFFKSVRLLWVHLQKTRVVQVLQKYEAAVSWSTKYETGSSSSRRECCEVTFKRWEYCKVIHLQRAVVLKGYLRKARVPWGYLKRARVLHVRSHFQRVKLFLNFLQKNETVICLNERDRH